MNKEQLEKFDKKFNKDWSKIAGILLDISNCEGVFIWMTKYGWLYKDEVKQFISDILKAQRQEIIEMIDETIVRGMIYDGERSKTIKDFIKTLTKP